MIAPMLKNKWMKRLGPWLLAFATAVFLRLSFPRFYAWPLAWFAFLPLMFAMEKRRTGQVLRISYFSGLVFYYFLLSWLGELTMTGMLALIPLVAVSFLLFGVAWQFARRHLSSAQTLVFIPCFWVVEEYIRTYLLTGFPWALLAYTQTPCLITLQAVDLFGSWGLSFLIMLVNVFVFQAVTARKEPSLRRHLAVLVCVLILWFAYGAWRLYQKPPIEPSFKVAVVQSNIDREIKWLEEFREPIFRKHVLLSEICSLKYEPDLIVWPETSFTLFLELGQNDEDITALAKRLKTPLLVGSVRFEDGHYYNSALLYDGRGHIKGIYDKLHLVPFGEFFPLRSLLKYTKLNLAGDFTRGQGPTVFLIRGKEASSPPLRFGVLICFEIIFPDMARNLAYRNVDFLVNMTNDQWFGDTACPFQHVQASILRAVENRVSVVRSANTGVSCIINDSGRMTSVVQDKEGRQTFVKGETSGLVASKWRRSLYASMGDLFILLAIVFIFGMIGAQRRKS